MTGRHFAISEKNIYVSFYVREDGVVELERFVPRGSGRDADISQEEIEKRGAEEVYPIAEINVTGKSTRGMHGYRHNCGSASCDFKYKRHEINGVQGGKELVITLQTDENLYLYYHMRFYDEIPVVRVYSVLENKGEESVPVEYISSFVYQDVCGGGSKPYYDKTDVYLPYNSWVMEAQWKKEDLADLNLSRLVDGYNLFGFGNNRFAYTGHSSWSSVEYLPMGMCHDRETNETCVFQVESSGQWHIEYDSTPGRRLTLCLSGPTEQEHGWWIDLKPGRTFKTIPAAFGIVTGGISEGIGALTQYRRAMRRPNEDDIKCNIVFNDYMNCLFGDPTEEKEKPIIDKAAEMGCEYFCIDCGWYDKGFWWDRVGQWMESPERFPNGMKTVADYAKEKGMGFGVWLEIEAMGIVSEFAKGLPDSWFICRHGKRHIDNKRYLLDFRNPEVYQYCMGVVDRLINDYGIGYFKIDYNQTQGIGSDTGADSCAQAMLEYYDALHRWYEEIFRKYPDLIIENCGSGGMRMDYGMLSLLSLQSTSDQTGYINNSYIAANVATAVTPEQAGMWVYPYEDEEEHVIYNMVNGLLLRPYMSGQVWKMSDASLQLMKEGISLYKRIRKDVSNGAPYWPDGLNHLKDKVLSYGIKNENKAYLSVFCPATDYAEISLDFGNQKIKNVRVIYPQKVNCQFSVEGQMLKVRMPEAKTARLFEIDLIDD